QGEPVALEDGLDGRVDVLPQRVGVAVGRVAALPDARQFVLHVGQGSGEVGSGLTVLHPFVHLEQAVHFVHIDGRVGRCAGDDGQHAGHFSGSRQVVVLGGKCAHWWLQSRCRPRWGCARDCARSRRVTGYGATDSSKSRPAAVDPMTARPMQYEASDWRRMSSRRRWDAGSSWERRGSMRSIESTMLLIAMRFM